MTNWQQYINKTKGNKPRDLLVKAAEFIKNKEAALDMGGGALNDSIFLSDLGFKKIYAIDLEESEELIKKIDKKIFTFKKVAIENYIFPINYFDLINAQFVLLFVDRQKISKVVSDIKKSLKADGLFVGQFFGLNDSWSGNSNICTHSKDDVDKILSDMDIIYFQEEEKDAVTAMGQAKHWHIFHFIVRKK